MVDTPKIGDTKPEEHWPPKVRVSQKEVLKFMKDKRIPLTKRNTKMARRKLRKQKQRDLMPRGRDTSISQSSAPWQVVYGVIRVSGVLSFLQQSANKTTRYYMFTIACHEIEKVTTLFCDGNSVTFGGGGSSGWATGGTKPDGTSIDYTNKVYWDKSTLGTAGQNANASLLADLPAYWISTDRQRNRAHVYVKSVWDAVLFGQQEPDFSFLVKGKKVYDPRTGTTRGSPYSSNAALVIADFLTDTVYGMGYPWASIDTGTSPGGLQWAADICDEAVPLSAGGTEKRYTINCSFELDLSPGEILTEMEACMGGMLTYTGGKFKFWPGKYTTPTLTLTDDDLRSAPLIETLISKRELINSVRGQYVSSENGYAATDFPAVQVSDYITEDGETLWDDVSYPMVTSSPTAQRLAKMKIEAIRRGITHNANWSLKAFESEVGDFIYVTSVRYGWSSKVFLVADWDLLLDKDGSLEVALVLRESDSGVFDWDETQDENDVSQAPATSLPDAGVVEPPTNLALASGTSYLYTKADGGIASKLHASWTAPTDAYVLSGGDIELQFGRNAGSYGSTIVLGGDSTEYDIMDVEDGVSYKVRIRSKSNITGAVSAWVAITGHTVAGKTVPPSTVASLSTTVEENGIRLNWDAISDLDLKEYEIRVGASWAAGTVIDKTKANTYLWAFQAAGSYTLRVKARDTSLNYSTTDATAALTITAPGAVRSISSKVIDNNVLLDWEAPTTGSQPVVRYEIRKGATYATAPIIGYADITIHGRFELISGTYTYWVTAIDAGGNLGTAASISATVNEPAGYAPVFDDTLPAELADATNIIVGSSGGILWDNLPLESSVSATCWLDFAFGVTLSNQRVNQLADQEATLANFTQGTTNKSTWVSRTDNREERFRKTSIFSSGGWDVSGYPASISGNTLTATAGSAKHGLYYTSSEGERKSNNVTTFTLSAHLQYINNQYAWVGESGDGPWRGVMVDLLNGTITNTYNIVSSSISARSGGGYIVKVTYLTTVCSNHTPGVWFSNTSGNSSPPTFTAAGTEQMTVHEMHWRSSSADDYDLENNSDLSQFRGINGNKVGHFQGGQASNSSSTLATLLPDAAKKRKLIYLLLRPDATGTGTTQEILKDSGAYLEIRMPSSGAQIDFRNYSSSYATASIPITAGQVVLIRCRQDGDTIYIAKNTGSGFGAEVSAASGATSLLTGTLQLGANATSLYFFGAIGHLSVLDQGTLDHKTDAIEQYLQAKWFEPHGRHALEMPTGTIVGPADDSQSWGEYFTDNGWDDLQDAINDGYEYIFQPGPDAGSSFEYVKNIGATVESATVSVTWDEQILQGEARVRCTISVSADGVTYTDYDDQPQIFAQNFDYVKVLMEIDDLSGDAAFQVDNLRLRIMVKQDDDTGVVDVLAADAGGTTVLFNKTFLSVDEDILTTPQSTTFAVSTVDFTSTPNPTSFKILLWDADENRIDGTVRWRARGVVGTV